MTISGGVIAIAMLIGLYALIRGFEYTMSVLYDEPRMLPPPPTMPPPPVPPGIERGRAEWESRKSGFAGTGGTSNVLLWKCPYCGIVSREPERCASCGAPR